MPRRHSNIYERKEKYESSIQAMIDKYGGRHHLEEGSRRFRRGGSEEYRRHYNDFRKFCKAEKELRQLKDTTESKNHINNSVCCCNCRRRNNEAVMAMDADLYTLSFYVKSSDDLRRRKFKSFRTSKNSKTQHMLCGECLTYLTSDNSKEIERNAWPAFIWKTMIDNQVKLVYGNNGWRLIPKQWRYWWLESLMEYENETYGDIQMNHPKPSIIDISFERKDWKKLIQSYELPKLAEACNKYLRPTVLCPFGCSEFIHKGGTVSMDLIFQRYLHYVVIETYSNRVGFDYVKNAREDFIELKDGDESKWLLNDEWKVMPSVLLINGEAKIITCSDHDRGDKSFHLHVCKQPHHNLSSLKSDQLCHGVLKSRTIKPMQKRIYSDSYQMHEQRGTFNGIDTCNVTSYHNFNFRSKLQSENESRSIINRPDMNSLLSQLTREKSISHITANDKRKLAKRLYEGFDFIPFIYGSTYVPIQIALEYQRENSNPFVKIIIDDREDRSGNALPDIVVKNKIYWPPSLYPCQKMTKWGAYIPVCPTVRSRTRDSRHVWIVMHVILGIEDVYMNIRKGELRKSDWKGWLLVYLTKNCYTNNMKRQGRGDVFKWRYINTVDDIISKFPDGEESVFRILESIDGVECINLNQYDDELTYGAILEIQNNEEPQILLTYPNHEYVDEIFINGKRYELRQISDTWYIDQNKWDGELFTRHGGYFSRWFHQKRNSKMTTQVVTKTPSLSGDEVYLFVYVCDEGTELTKVREEFLRNIGGQSHVRCHSHSMPLIRSTESSLKCKCGRRSYLRCSTFECKVNICRQCFEKVDREDTYHLHEETNEEMVMEGSESECESEEDSSVESVYNYEDETRKGEYEEEDRSKESDTENDEEVMKDYFLPKTSELEREDFDHFVTTTFDPDLLADEASFEESFDDANNIPISNAGEVHFDVEEDHEKKGVFADVTVNGYTILNQCGSLLTRKNHQLKGSSTQQFFLQKICSTSFGNSIPLLYPEGLLFPSIFYSAAGDKCSILGAIPSSLLSEGVTKFGFRNIPEHIRTNLTSPLCSTNSNPRYIAFSYDMAVNLACNREDTRCIINNGLTVADSKTGGGLGVRGKEDSTLLDSVESKRMVKNLCSAQVHHKMDVFLTFTCNMKKHFGTKVIKNWIDEGLWKKSYPCFNDLDEFEIKEIETSVSQASSGLLLRIWQEVCTLFLEYLRKSPSSPYKSVLSIFARFEYQKFRGNLSHTHLLLEVNWQALTHVHKDFLLDLVRSSVLEVVRSNEVEDLIRDGTFSSVEDHIDMIKDAISFLPHKCTSGCQAKVVVDGKIEHRCRKLNNLKVSEDNTKHTFRKLPNEISDECKERLVKIGLAEDIEEEENGYRKDFKSHLPLFHPKRHIPPTNPNGDLNISPVEGYTFANCLSMQNIQVLTQSGGVNKYVCKYIAKIDEQNYIVVGTHSHKNGTLVPRYNYLCCTKRTTTEINENIERQAKRDSHHPQGRMISLLEMIHQLLCYPEVITNLEFVNIPTIPLELRSGVRIEKKRQAKDGVHIGSLTDDIRRTKGVEEWRQHRENELLMIDDLQNSKISIDNITLFSLRPPELREIIKKPGQYFRWFQVRKRVMKGQHVSDLLNFDVNKSAWIDGLQHQVFMRKKAAHEVMIHINSMEINDPNGPRAIMVDIFQQIQIELESEVVLNEEFRSFIDENLVEENNEVDHLPCPVYSYLKPTTSHSFLHHILLSMGEFDTEIDLKMHASIREAFRYAKLIGPDDDDESLQRYSNEVLKSWVTNQLQYFPNALRILATWIVVAGNLFDSVIVRNELAITDMPSVQLSTLFGNDEEQVKEYLGEVKMILIKAVLEEIGEATIENCRVPSIDALEECSKEAPLEWNAYTAFSKYHGQSDDSFREQEFAIRKCVESINKYTNLWELDTFTKNVGIRGFPGSGKTWCALYISLYALSKGLNVMTTAILAKRARQIGGIHYHKLFCLPIGNNLSVHRRAELAIMKLLKNPRQLNILLSLDVLVCDELSQISAEFFTTIDMILRKVRDSNIILGGVLLIGTIDHTQIQPINGSPFLTATHVVTCFRMVALNHSVRASQDVNFQRIQAIARKSYIELENNPQLVDEMISLCSEHLTFVADWNDPKIDKQAMRLYSKKVPAKEAAKDFERRVRRQVHPNELRQRLAEDVEKPRYSQLEWSKARDSIVGQLEQKLKEPQCILFFKGAIFECTFNDPRGQFTQSQMALLYELPSTEAIEKWEKIKVLVAPPGMKEIEYEPHYSKEDYVAIGFEEVKIGISPEHSHSVTNDMFAKRKQYGLRHHVVMTVHAAMGDTLKTMITRISTTDNNFAMWDKGQLIVILSRTKEAKKSIFVGPKDDTLAAFRQLVLRKTQWSLHMEKVLNLITVNADNGNESRVMNTESFPYLIRNIVLPQCNTGYVYMLISIKMRNYIYIGTTNCIRSRLLAHNSGYGSTSTEPAYLRPYALFAYICGFGGGRADLRYYIENKWKEKRDQLIQSGTADHRTIALSANSVIQSLNEGQFGIAPSELALVCLFQ